MFSDLKYTVDPEDKIKFSLKNVHFICVYEFLQLYVFITLHYSNK